MYVLSILTLLRTTYAVISVSIGKHFQKYINHNFLYVVPVKILMKFHQNHENVQINFYL